MKQHLLLLIIISLLSFKMPGQGFKYVIEDVSAKDFTGLHNETDPDAPAVVLFDIGKSYFVQTNDGFQIGYERKCRIRINSEKGYDWGKIEIPYYKKGNLFENVISIKGITYNLVDGKLTGSSIDQRYIYDETLGDNWYMKKFAMPDIRRGSIIDFEYHVYSPYHFNLRDWEFQRTIPTIYSEYEVVLIPFYEYSWTLQNAAKFDVYNSYVRPGVQKQYGPIKYNDMVHQMIMKNVPAFQDEEFIPSVNDYLIKVDFQLSRFYRTDGTFQDVVATWPEMIKQLLKESSIGGYLDRSRKLAGKLVNLDSLALLSPENRFQAVVNFVKDNYNWNSRGNIFASRNPADLVREKAGNSAEINLLLTGILRAAGFEAVPLILSTREHGTINTDYPFQHMFNYVIVMADVNGSSVLTDATEPLSMNHRIPVRCLNNLALVLSNDRVSWVNLYPQYVSVENTEIKLQYSPNISHFQAEYVISTTEYEALKARKKYGGDVPAINRTLSQKYYSIDNESTEVYNYTNRNRPFIIKFNTSGKPEIIGDKLFITPFLGESVSENPFKHKERKYPINMIYPYKKEYKATIVIPEGYKVEELPEKYEMSGKGMEMTYNTSAEENLITVFFSYTMKQINYPAAEYNTLKNFFNLAINKSGQKIVLVRQ